jgi:hypothetical protein
MKRFTILFAFVLFLSTPGFSQPDVSKEDWKVPVLNEHTFPSLAHFRSSFVTTNVQANLGVGITSPVKIAGFMIDDHEVLGFEGQIIFLNMDVQYQQRFNPWLSMYLNFTLAGRVGSDLSTILADGVNTISGGGIGWLFRIYQSKKLNLSGSFDVNNINGSFMNVSQYVEDLVNDVPDASVTKTIPSLSAGLGVQGAYAFSPVFGAQFHASYYIGETFSRDGTKNFYSAGIMGDVDFLPRQSVPIGLALGYTITSSPYVIMAEGGYSHMIGGKIAYTGSKEFELGLQYTYYKLNIEDIDSNPSINHVTLVVKLFF